MVQKKRDVTFSGRKSLTFTVLTANFGTLSRYLAHLNVTRGTQNVVADARNAAAASGSRPGTHDSAPYQDGALSGGR